MRAGLSNYFSSQQDPANANSVPSYDELGPDFLGYWSLADWITWHQALVTALGLSQANQKFLTAWNEQSFGSSPVNDLEFNTAARTYLRQVGVLQQIPASLFGELTDFSQGVGNTIGAASAASAKFDWLIPVAGIAVLYFAIQAIGKDPGGQSKKFFSGVRELY